VSKVIVGAHSFRRRPREKQRYKQPILNVCLYREPCEFKRIQEPSNRNRHKKPIPICVFEGTCNQKTLTTYPELNFYYQLDIGKLRKARFHFVRAWREWVTPRKTIRIERRVEAA